MPLWQIYHPPTAFETEELKQALAKDVTSHYTNVGLPAFYVVVQFIPLPLGSSYCGGEKTSNFVRIVVHHLAYQSQGKLAAHQRIVSGIDRVLKPHVADKGYDFEYHVSESPETMWKINGLVPPPHKSEAMEKWARENKPTPY